MKKSLLVFSLFIALLFIASPCAEAQCSMCRAVVESNEANQGEGLNNGILYLMGFPYIIMLVLGIIIYRKVSRDNLKFRGEPA